jgi:hypothetical protein
VGGAAVEERRDASSALGLGEVVDKNTEKRRVWPARVHKKSIGATAVVKGARETAARAAVGAGRGRAVKRLFGGGS